MDVKWAARLSVGWIVGLVVVTMPLVLWAGGSQLPDLGTQTGFLTIGAKVSAFTGLAMYAWSLILGARLRWVEWLYGGLDKVYKAHHIYGGTAFILILMHPLFLTVRSVVAGRSVAALWNPFTSFFLGAGIVALAIMVVALYQAYYANPKHQWFIRIHNLLGWAIILAALHTFLSHGNIYDNQALRRYTIVLIGVAVAAFLYHSVFGKFLIQRFRYVVVAVNELGQGIFELVLKRRWRPIVFTPGQFAYVTLKDPDVDQSEPHPFSFSSSSKDDYIRFVVKNLGDYTSGLGKVDIGTEALIEGPYGKFSYRNTKNRHQVWVAGGIGVTPFLSMARSLRKNSSYKIDIYYCTRVPEEAVFTYELKRIAQRHKGVRVISVCESRDGFLTADTIQKHSGDLTAKNLFICGPPVMMKSLQQQMREKGVDETRIQTEEFSY